VTVLDSRNSLVRSDEAVLTTMIGLDNVAVVTTVDTVLVAARDKAEESRPSSSASSRRYFFNSGKDRSHRSRVCVARWRMSSQTPPRIA
jgi:hypothetical protein